MRKTLIHSRSAQAGFSVIEGLVAALLLLVVVLGVLPLVTRAMSNNVQGNDATTQANGAVSGFERLLSLPFDRIDTTIPAGTTSLTTQEVWTRDTREWIPLASFAPGDAVIMSRDVTIEQFGVSDFDDNGILDTPLSGDTAPTFVQLKRISMTIRGRGMVSFTPYRLVTVQAF